MNFKSIKDKVKQNQQPMTQKELNWLVDEVERLQKCYAMKCGKGGVVTVQCKQMTQIKEENDDLRNEIIELWHDPYTRKSLRECLLMSKEDYEKWLKDSKCLDRAITKR